MDIRRFKPLHDAGAVSYAEIARECGVDYRTVKKVLAKQSPGTPPVGSSRKGTQPRVITGRIEALIRSMLAGDVELKASVICERLASDYDVHVHYQRVKLACRELRPLVQAEADEQDPSRRLRGLHRRFEVLPGAQAQVDWGDEGDLFGDGRRVYSFHMTLSFSRDPFCCFVTSMDAPTFWACHVRAFTHFGGVPAAIVYDRTKTIVRRHVAPGKAVPLVAEAVAFAGHYGFVIDVLAAYRPTGKGRVERQVDIVRDHVLAGRRFTSIGEVDAAFMTWVPIRRSQVHRTYGQVIAERAATDHAALSPLPQVAYEVSEVHTRRVGKDCLISFLGSLYSVPAVLISAGQRVEVRPTGEQVSIRALPADGGDLLATHPRATRSGSWVVDPSHWDGLPDGRTRATTTIVADLDTARDRRRPRLEDPPAHVAAALRIHVATRPLEDYTSAAGMEGTR